MYQEDTIFASDQQPKIHAIKPHKKDLLKNWVILKIKQANKPPNIELNIIMNK